MNPLVLQSDFGHADGAVSAMYGVAMGVCPELRIYDLTHDIPQFNIWEASYRLIQTVGYWPAGTVFASIVDPGVGSHRRSVAVRTAMGHIIITPDNGTLTHIKRMMGVAEVRVIDEDKNRLVNSGESYTFHGRDIFAYTGAKLAAGLITLADIGPEADPATLTELPVFDAVRAEDIVSGSIDVLDVRFGSLWTDIPRSLFNELRINYGSRVEVTISNGKQTLYKNIIVYARSFAEVNVGEPLLYVNSLDCMAVAINQGSFARAYNIGTGNQWHISLRKAPRVVYE